MVTKNIGNNFVAVAENTQVAIKNGEKSPKVEFGSKDEANIHSWTTLLKIKNISNFLTTTFSKNKK